MKYPKAAGTDNDERQKRGSITSRHIEKLTSKDWPYCPAGCAKADDNTKNSAMGFDAKNFSHNWRHGGK